MKILSIFIISFLTACQSNYTHKYIVGALSEKDATEYQLDPSFYKKVTKVQNILIATSQKVSDHAHRETAYLFDIMMKRVKPEIAQRVRDKAILCILVAHNEMSSDIPQFKTEKTGKELAFYNWRSRGSLSKKNKRLTVFFAEEDVLEYKGGSRKESVLIHEFGHVVHKAGFDKVFEDRLKATHKNAMDKGLWRDGRAAQRFRRIKSEKTPVLVLDALVKSFPNVPRILLAKCLDNGDITINGKKVDAQAKAVKKDNILIVFGGEKPCYGTTNRAEYFAEGFQIWYDTNRTMDHDHNHITTRKQLIAYDPMLAKLCEDVQGTSDWRFISPRQRAGQEHLKDFDPEKSPERTQPGFIQEAALDYYDKYWKDYWPRLAKKHDMTLRPYKHTYIVGTLSSKDAKEYQLDPSFYKKVTKVQNILIATSAKVTDTTHRETAYLFDMMMKRVKPEIAQRVRDKAILCILVAHDELTSDIPHFKTKKTGKDLDFYNWRSRGFLTKKNKRFTVFFAEEDVLEYKGGSHNESILIHEFGHVIHKAGFDKIYEDRLKATYKNAIDKGLWRDGLAAQGFRRIDSKDVPVSVLNALVKSFPKIPRELLIKCLDHGDITINGKKVNSQAKAVKRDDILITFGGEKACYATVNRAEYFAEGFQIWYDTNRTMDHDHNHITTRKQLLTYDPMLAKLCQDIQGNSDWRFISPRLRGGKEHLIDFDPDKSPKKISPDFIRAAALDYYDKYWDKYWERLAKKYRITLK